MPILTTGGIAPRNDTIGAEIAEAADSHGEELAVLVERKRRIDDVVARVVIADVRFVAGCDPFHRPADAARRPQHQDDLRIDRAAQAVGAADIAGDQPNSASGILSVVSAMSLRNSHGRWKPQCSV